MTDKQDQGQTGEDMAAAFLENKGFKILERNFRAGQSEIDIVTMDKECLVFVEVRLRKNADYGLPEQSMSKAKMNALKRGAESYMRKRSWLGDVRFDFIAIIQKPDLDIEHFQDIFY
ncbi:MAG: YraN family protein [Spirosomaceae bacterium]|nr:YraN family protein [Spirosomataceae bacterium]